MNIVNAGKTFQIYGDELKTFKTLPAASYEVNFSKMQGFYLTQRNDLVVNEEKIYGNHIEKVSKVLNTFSKVDRNLGVILSGDKGIGKSLFARLLAAEGVKNNIPLIVVSSFVPGIDSFISSIEQEVIVLFDEFEKTFKESDEGSPQESMLSLFDGIDNGKKLFVITCNKTSDLNEYLLNRPGRFHYHFMLSTPSGDEIIEYMTDKLESKYHEEIPTIVTWAATTGATYDQLRAIAFEINMGYSFQETLLDLNIEKQGATPFYITIQFEDGSISDESYERFSLYDEHRQHMWINDYLAIRFFPKDIKYDLKKQKYYLDTEKIQYHWDRSELDGLEEEAINQIKRKYKVAKIHIRKADNVNKKYLLI